MTTRSHDLASRLTAEANHAEATQDADLAYRRRRPTGGQTVYGLRLPPERLEQLRRVAGARGIEPSVLARTWMIEQLDKAEAGVSDPATDRWEHDLRATADHLRDLLDQRPGA